MIVIIVIIVIAKNVIAVQMASSYLWFSVKPNKEIKWKCFDLTLGGEVVKKGGQAETFTYNHKTNYN